MTLSIYRDANVVPTISLFDNGQTNPYGHGLALLAPRRKFILNFNSFLNSKFRTIDLFIQDKRQLKSAKGVVRSDQPACHFETKLINKLNAVRNLHR
jgi:hypothetical protein